MSYTGSNVQVVGLEAVTRLVKASGEIISNCERVHLVRVIVPASIKVLESASFWEDCGPLILSLIESMLFVRNFRKSSALNEELLAGVFCVSLAIVSNRNCGIFFINVNQVREICCPNSWKCTFILLKTLDPGKAENLLFCHTPPAHKLSTNLFECPGVIWKWFHPSAFSGCKRSDRVKHFEQSYCPWDY